MLLPKTGFFPCGKHDLAIAVARPPLKRFQESAAPVVESGLFPMIDGLLGASGGLPSSCPEREKSHEVGQRAVR